MSANVETMFYVGRSTPWHGLGVSIEAAPTSADALVAANLDWQVIQKDVHLPNGDVISGYKANVRETDNSVLGIVTNKYKIVQNEEAFAFVDELLGEGCTYETAGSLANGKRVWMLAKMPESYKCLDDKIDPYLVINNSHDGKGSIFVAMTPIRVVCQNTLNLALRTADRMWKTHHIGTIGDKLLEAQRTLQLGNVYMKELEAEAWNLAKVKLSDEKVNDYIRMLIPMPDNAGTTKTKNIIQLRQGLWERYKNAPDLQHVGKNGFRFVNAVSDFATHSTPLRRTANYQANMFMKTVDGNALIDKAYEMVQEAV